MPSQAAALGSISVVIPAYNAARTLAATIAQVERWLTAAGLPHEIIVVDDGSADGTAAIARAAAPPVRLISYTPNRGKGAAVRTGMLACAIEVPAAGTSMPRDDHWVLFMDADNSTTIDHLDRFAAMVGGPNAPEVVIASRRLNSSRIVRPQHPIRRALGRTFPLVVRAIALPDITDTQCGFKLFSGAAARAIFPLMRTDRFAFDVEALLLARRLGFAVAEVPVDWDNPTVSTVQIHRDTIRMLWDLVTMTLRVRWGPAPTPPASRSPPRTAPPPAPAPPPATDTPGSAAADVSVPPRPARSRNTPA